MKRNDLIKVIIVIGMASLFLLQYVGMILDPTNTIDGGEGVVPTQYQGVAVVNATIDYYERVLYAFDLDYETTQMIQGYDEVKEINPIEEYYEISLKKKEDVVPVYERLKEMDITTYATAKITLQPSIAMYDEQGNEINGYFYNRVVKISGLEPIFPSESIITVQTEVVIQEEQAYQVGTMEIYAFSKSIQTNATVFEKNHFFEFIVPWESKSQINTLELEEEYGKEKVYYELNNQIIFQEPLSVEEQVEKKYDYIDYISANYALVSDGFSNSSKIIEDFGSEVILPNSTLLISGDELEQMEFESKEYTTYKLSIEGVEEYILNDEIKNQAIISNKSIEINQTITVDLEIIVTGNNILGIDNILVI